MSYSFIGPYFLNPYLARYEQALNLAADAFSDPTTDHDPPTLLDRPPPATPAYTLVRSKNVGMTAVLLFARDPLAIADVQEAEVGFGAAEMGNKGAAGVRVLYEARDTGESTEMTFVGTHLAAMEWNLARRNANWAAIMRGLTFEDPEEILKPRTASSDAASQGDGEEGQDVEDVVRLLHDQHNEESREMQRRLQDISVFKPTSHLFVGGDLNYRISATSPTPGANFPSLDPESENYHPRFFPLDQLTRERTAGRTLHGLTEAEVEFPPTYKYDVVSGGTGSGNPLDVAWKFAPHRYPSWTDRVLYLDTPAWTKSLKPETPGIKVHAYNAFPVIATSDHRAVFFRATVPMVPTDDLLPPARDDSYSPEWDLDPRARLPVEVDPEAWGRRAAARQKEVMAGWSMFLWSTQEGALILGTVVIAAISGWWLYQQL